ncbi:pentatricopeptide repeat-containing protein [Senna tora]|uniref:Pentatricopeptide repeat-containing protein n=1 Tax=Senna tora TaxID=362788 RepID=A0A834XDX6_9FABA|nr:pentatricopeptide repeat-containing protein [Senna tora]
MASLTLHYRSPASSFINIYSKCNLMNHASKVFNYPSHDDKNVFAYTAIIVGFIANKLPQNGFEFYKTIRWVRVVPDKFTFSSVIRSCGEVVDAFEVEKIHGLLFKLRLELDVFVGSALVNAYLKFGLMMEAQEVFDELTVRDVVLWNSMVNGYAKIGGFDEAFSMFRLMGINGVVPSIYTVIGLLSIFSVKGDSNNGRAANGFVIKMGYDSNVAVSNALIDMILGEMVKSNTVCLFSSSSISVCSVMLSANPVLHSRSKHVELDLYFVRERVDRKEIEVHHIPTSEQVADILTKPVSSSSFHVCTNKLRLADAKLSLRGDVSV